MDNRTDLSEFSARGYLVLRGVFNPQELSRVLLILKNHHEAWIEDNRGFYETQAVNSAYITNKKYLTDNERLTLFNFITDEKILDALASAIPDKPTFLGTQLFFNPYNHSQKNYWHRDMQYNNEPLEKQKANLTNQIPLHVRVAMRDEPGLELIPGTHKRWDTLEEYTVRMEDGARHNYDALPGTIKLPLNAGDILVFSANMIHRGLYGQDRFAFDLLFTDQNPEILKFADPSCLPDQNMLRKITNKAPYERTLSFIQSRV